MAGDDQFEEQEQELAMSFKMRNDVIIQERERLLEENAQLKAELAEFEGPTPLETLSQRRKDFLSDIEKFNNLIATLKTHLAKNKKKYDDNLAELQQKRAEAEALTQEKARLEDIFQHQELTPADVERIKNARAKLDEQLKAVVAKKEELDQRAWKSEMALSKKLEVAENMANEFNRLAESLQLLPRSAPNANGVNYEIKINPHTPNMREIVSVDMKGTVVPNLTTLRESINERVHRINGELVSANEMLAKLGEMVTEKQDDNSIMDNRLKSMEKQYAEEKEALSDEYKKQVAGVEELQNEIGRIRMHACNVHMDSERELERLHLEYEEEMKVKSSNEKEALHKLAVKAITLVTAHKVSWLKKQW